MKLVSRCIAKLRSIRITVRPGRRDDGGGGCRRGPQLTVKFEKFSLHTIPHSWHWHGCRFCPVVPVVFPSPFVPPSGDADKVIRPKRFDWHFSKLNYHNELRLVPGSVLHRPRVGSVRLRGTNVDYMQTKLANQSERADDISSSDNHLNCVNG